MAEYIWIDGHGGVRSKTKVRISVTATRPYHPHTASMHTNCTILQPFAPAQNPSRYHRNALIGRADSKISLGAELNASTIAGEERYKRAYTCANFGNRLDPGHAMQRRQRAIGVEF